MQRKVTIFLVLFVMAMMVMPVLGWAQLLDQKQPIEIEADTALEWVQKENKYIARGNAVAKQGKQQIKADVISALSAKEETGAQALREIIAEGSVVLSSPEYTAMGERAVYDPKTGILTLTGGDLTVKTQDQILTAKNYILYDQQKGEMIAQGQAEVKRATDRMTADQVQIFFTKEGQTEKKGQQAEKLIAQGNVVIYTKTEEIYGDHGLYHLVGEHAEITGRVKIRQGQNVLTGGKATLNLKTGISKLFADTKSQNGTGRVKGTFFPE